MATVAPPASWTYPIDPFNGYSVGQNGNTGAIAHYVPGMSVWPDLRGAWVDTDGALIRSDAIHQWIGPLPVAPAAPIAPLPPAAPPSSSVVTAPATAPAPASSTPTLAAFGPTRRTAFTGSLASAAPAAPGPPLVAPIVWVAIAVGAALWWTRR